MKRAPLTLLALHPDTPAVCFDDEPAEREPQPGAPHARNVRRSRLFELPEDDIVVLSGDPGSIVGDGESDTKRFGPRRQRQRDGPRRVHQRVLYQIPEHPLEQPRVSGDSRPVVVENGIVV